MVSDIYILKKFVDENKFEDSAIINKEKLCSFILVETKHSLFSINTSLRYFIILGFLEKIDKTTYLLKKKKLDEFLKRDQ